MNKDQLCNHIVDTSKNLIWVVNTELNLVYANSTYLNLMKEVTGKVMVLNNSVFIEGFGAGYVEKWKTYYTKALKGNYFEIEEHYFNPKTKAIQYGLVTFTPIREGNGKILTVACQSRDITKIVQEKSEVNQLMDASLDVFCTVNETGNFLFVSAASKSHWGYSPEELKNQSFYDFVLEEDLPKTREIADSIFRGNDVKAFVNRYRKKDGTIAYNLWSARWDKESKLVYCVARDAQEKIEQEERNYQSELRFKALVQEGSDLIGILDKGGNYMYVSPTCKSILGIPPEDFIGKNALEFIHPEDVDTTLASLQEIGTQSKVIVAPFRFQNQKKEWRWMETVLTNMIGIPGVDGIVANSRDITDKIEEEHRLKLLEKLVHNASDAIIISDAEPLDEPGPLIVYVNEAFTKMTGYTAEEVIGKNPRLLQGPNSNREDLKNLGEKLRRWESADITVLNYTKSGEEFWVNFAVSPVADHRGWFTHWISVQREVTEQKKQEAKKELLSQISQSFNNGEELMRTADRLCENLYAFGKFDLIELWCPNLEQTQMNLMGHSFQNQEFHTLEPSESSFRKNEGLPGTVWQNGKQLLWDEKQISEYFIRKKVVSRLGLQAMLGIPLTNNEELTGVLLIGTKRKSGYLEQHRTVLNRLDKFIGSKIKRKRLEDDLKHLYQAIPDILCIVDSKGRFLKMNPAGYELLGYNEEEILFHSCDKFVHPEDKHVYTNKLERLKKGVNTFQFENRYLTKSGKIIWLNWSCNSSIHEGLIYASAKNITKEVQLRELNKQASSLARIGSWEIDVVHNKLFWTDMVHVLHETDPLRFTPDLETDINFYREDFKEMVRKQTANCVANGTPFNFEAVLVTAKNNERWVRCIGNPEFLNEKCIRVYGSFQDIHDGKLFEEALRESEAKFRTIFEIASLGIAQVSPVDGQILLVNSYYKKIMGYSHEELLQMKFSELTHPDDRKRDWDLFSKAARGEIEYRNEKRYIRKDGSIVWVRIHLAFIRDDLGNPIKTVAICENITERKEIESRLKNLADNVPGVVFQYVIYPDGRDELNYISKGSKTIWGFEPEEAMANNQLVWNRIEAGGDLDLVKGSISDSIRSKSRWNATWKYHLPTGEIRSHIGHGSPEYLADGTVVFNSLILDITEEKRTEDLLNQATFMAKIGSWEMEMIDQENDGMYWSSMTRQILEVDDSYDPSLTGGFEFYAGEDKDKIERAVGQLIEKGQEFDLELRITTKRGKEKWIRAIGKSERVNGRCIKIYGSFQDIHAAKSNELRVKEILGSISDAFCAVDVDWNFTYFNRAAENLLKKSSKEILSGNIWEILYPAKGTFLEEVFRRVAITEQSENFEYQYPGDGCWYEITTYPSSGGVSAYFKNIDGRRRAAEDLAKAYKEKNEILERIGDAFFALDEQWNVTYWNKRAEEIIGIPRENLIGHNLWAKFPLAKDLEFFKQYERAFKTQTVVNFEEYFQPFEQWYEANGYPSPEGISVFFRDITEKKIAEERILDANERFELIAKATKDAIWDYNIADNTLFWGDGFKTLFGYEIDRITPTMDLWTSLIHPEDIERVTKSISASQGNNRNSIWSQEYRFEKADGTFAFVHDKGIIIRNQEGEVVRVLGALSDFTQLKKQETELLEINKSLENYAKELERSNEELEQFAFVTSHDLQEPLRMISSFMDQLKRKYKDQLDEKGLEYIEFAVDGAKRMKQIILDLLLYSKASNPTEKIEIVNLNELLSDFKHLRRRHITEKKATIISSELPVFRTYKAPMVQIIHSLLDNALKYSKENIPPFIEISFREKDTEWEFAIKDNGIGVDSQFYDKVFLLFQRLHNRNVYSGTGIGLSIAKRSVEFLGGSIWLTSTLGEGSIFYFTIKKE